MSKWTLQRGGNRVIADILSGSGEKLDGIYVTYAGADAEAAPEVDRKFFEYLEKRPACGYARIPVRSCEVQADGSMMFTGLLSASDLIGSKPTKRSRITTATLVSMNEDPTKDRFVYTALLMSQIPLVAGTHIVIDLHMKIGG
jgi:hypothetical protein